MATVKGQFIFNSYKTIEQHVAQRDLSFPSDDMMLAEISVSIEVAGVTHGPYAVRVKQVAGGKYQQEPVEVGRPEGYSGPFNYLAFQEAAEKYYRSCIRVESDGVNMEIYQGDKEICGGIGVSSLSFAGRLTEKEMRVDFEAEDPGHGW